MKKDTYYFSHDYNAHNDVKILFLRQQLGMEGYGIFWFLIESLADSGGILPMKIIPVLAMQMQVPEIKVKAVIESFDLFMINDEIFFSQRLLDHLQIRNVASENGKKGAKKRWENGGSNGVAIRGANGVAIGDANEAPNGNPNAKERKGKESKVYIHTNLELDEIKSLEIDEVVKGLLIYIQTKTDQVKLLKKQLSVDEGAELIAQFNRDEIKEVLNQMDNFNGLTKKYTSVYRTMLTWLKNNKKWERERASNKKKGSMEGFTGLTAN